MSSCISATLLDKRKKGKQKLFAHFCYLKNNFYDNIKNMFELILRVQFSLIIRSQEMRSKLLYSRNDLPFSD